MAENRVIVENVLSDASAPRVIASASVAVGAVSATDSTAPVLLLTIPAGKTFVGSLNVTANSRATTAAYARATVVVNGTNASPPDGTVIIEAGSSRDAGACPVTYPVQVTAPAGNSATLSLVLTTATTFNGSACCFGEFV